MIHSHRYPPTSTLVVLLFFLVLPEVQGSSAAKLVPVLAQAYVVLDPCNCSAFITIF